MFNLSRWKVTIVTLAAIFGILFTLPNLLPANLRAKIPAFLPNNTLRLGLDLQGGSDLLYSVDTNALRVERLTNLGEDVRQTLTEKQILNSDLAIVNGEVGVRITDPNQVNDA